MAKKRKLTRKNPKGLYALLGAVLLSIAGVTIAYAALSSVLNITINKVTQNKLTWAVAFDTTAVTPTKSRAGITCPAVTPTGTAVQIGNVEFGLPGDKCTYQLTVKNTGDIDATLSTITKIDPNSHCGTMSSSAFKCGSTGSTDPYVTVKLATNSAGTTALATGGTLVKTSGTQTVYLVLELNPGATSLPSSASTYSGVGFQLTYGQK